MKAESWPTCLAVITILAIASCCSVNMASNRAVKPPSLMPKAYSLTKSYFPVSLPSTNPPGFKPVIKLSWKWADNDGVEVKDWPKYRGYHRIEFAIESRSDATHWNWTQIGRVSSNSFTINNRLPQEQFRVKTMTNSLPWVYTR